MIEIDQPPWVSELLARGDRYRSDEEKIGLVVELARQNVVRDTGGPFGGAVFPVGGDRPVGVGVNVVEGFHNSVLHAETVALMVAEAELANHDLAGHELFASAEPCAMCLGAVHWANLERVVSSALREDTEAAGFDEGPVFDGSIEYLERRGVAYVRGVRRDEGAEVLRLHVARR